jgi:hypothetical protein
MSPILRNDSHANTVRESVGANSPLGRLIDANG